MDARSAASGARTPCATAEDMFEPAGRKASCSSAACRGRKAFRSGDGGQKSFRPTRDVLLKLRKAIRAVLSARASAFPRAGRNALESEPARWIGAARSRRQAPPLPVPQGLFIIHRHVGIRLSFELDGRMDLRDPGADGPTGGPAGGIPPPPRLPSDRREGRSPRS